MDMTDRRGRDGGLTGTVGGRKLCGKDFSDRSAEKSCWTFQTRGVADNGWMRQGLTEAENSEGRAATAMSHGQGREME